MRRDLMWRRAVISGLAVSLISCQHASGRAPLRPHLAPASVAGGVIRQHPGGGINVEPSMRPWRYLGPNPDSWWCSVPDCYQNPRPQVTIDAELSLARELHVSVLRIEFPWYLIEPDPGGYDFGRADLIVAAAQAHGVRLQPVLDYSPGWAADVPNGTPSAAGWSSFVSTMVTRYHTSITHWEMWNEPDLYTYWEGSQEQYVNTILRPGYKAAKAADPNAQVILGGPSSPDTEWLEGIYRLGGGDSFDIMAFHDYGWGSDDVNDAAAVQRVLDNHRQSHKPLWLGEFGDQEDTLSDNEQRQYLTDVLGTPSPLAMAIWYTLRDDDAMGCCPPKVVKAAHWGLVRHDDRTRKAAFDTLRSLLAAGAPALR